MYEDGVDNGAWEVEHGKQQNCPSHSHSAWGEWVGGRLIWSASLSIVHGKPDECKSQNKLYTTQDHDVAVFECYLDNEISVVNSDF